MQSLRNPLQLPSLVSIQGLKTPPLQLPPLARAWKTPLQLPSLATAAFATFLACLLPKCLLGLKLSFFSGSANDVRPSSSKSAPACQFFTIFKCNRALPSPARILSNTFPDRAAKLRKQRPSFGDHGRHSLPEKMQGFAPESVLKPEFTRSRSLTLPNYLHDDVVAMMIEVMMWLSLQSRAPFAILISPKCSDPVNFLRFLCVIELSLQSCTFCRSIFPIEPRNCGNRDPPSATTAATLYPKKYWVSRPRMFSSLNSRVPDLSHFPTICMMM